MLDKSALTMARKLATLLCEARHLAEELSQDLSQDAYEAKNSHFQMALEEVAEELSGFAEELNYMEGKADDLIAPFDKDMAS